MATNFTRERIHAEPKDTVGFREIRSGSSRVLLALRKNGKATAVTILKPRRKRR